ncbi:MAG: hypothetical protein ABSH50_16220 [Bryobacteraceae bacterium]
MAAQPAPDAVTLRVVFGYQRAAVKNYDGSVRVAGGVLRSIAPWRFLENDAITGANSWKLEIRRIIFENQPDAPEPMAGGPFPQNIVPAGIFVTVDSTASSIDFQTSQGNFSVRVADLSFGRELWFLDHDVEVQRVPTAQRISPKNVEEHDYPSIAVARNGEVWTAWQAYQDRGDHVYVRHAGGDPVRLTTDKGDIFRTSVAEDPDGRIHVVWSERFSEAWNLYERVFDGREWSARAQITHANVPNIYHKLIAGRAGLDLIWIGHEGGESYLYRASYKAPSGWSQPQRIGGPSVWNPDAAFDPEGNLHAAWDSYQSGNYDIFYRRITADGTAGAIEQVTKSPGFDAHPSLAVDGQGRPWLAWDQSGANWGKDWSHDDQYRSTVLYKDRSIRVLVKDSGVWKEGPDLAAAVPDRLRRYWQLPHLTADGTGRIWALFQIRTSAILQRIDYWAAAGSWDLYLTSIDHGVWQPAAIVPDSAGRNEAPFQIVPAAHSVWMAWATDGRDPGKSAASYQAGTMVHYDVFAAQASAPVPSGEPALSAYREAGGTPQVMHPHERDDVRRIRAYRMDVGGAQYRILRGDFHRHTDISNDGAGDGSLEDYYRYMLDAASMDTGIVTDHNMGGDIEYNWWRTEKFYDLFVIPGRFTPLFGYERSVNYPNGHRNVVFDHRGVRTLPVGADENQARVNSSGILYPYLRQNRGICMEHSLATGQGTDWRDNDPELEPLVEIYQGYHAAYEFEGGPRAESAGNHLLVHGAYEPSGFYWNALNKGYKLGVQASSDHISTHVSYAMILTPTVKRSEIVEQMRRRHAYAATDNIILDFQAVHGGGSAHLMGDVLTASRGLRLRVKVGGTDVLTRVELIRNGAVIYIVDGGGKKDADFEFRDTAPLAGENWYYIRATQIDRNLAWSSPIWVTYQ